MGTLAQVREADLGQNTFSFPDSTYLWESSADIKSVSNLRGEWVMLLLSQI